MSRSATACSRQLLSFALRPRCPIFVYGDAIFALPESLFIDYSGAKYVRSALKIAATQKSLFRRSDTRPGDVCERAARIEGNDSAPVRNAPCFAL